MPICTGHCHSAKDTVTEQSLSIRCGRAKYWTPRVTVEKGWLALLLWMAPPKGLSSLTQGSGWVFKNIGETCMLKCWGVGSVNWRTLDLATYSKGHWHWIFLDPLLLKGFWCSGSSFVKVSGRRSETLVLVAAGSQSSSLCPQFGCMLCGFGLFSL